LQDELNVAQEVAKLCGGTICHLQEAGPLLEGNTFYLECMAKSEAEKQKVEAERKKLEVEKVEAERKKVEVEKVEARRKKLKAEKSDADRKK